MFLTTLKKPKKKKKKTKKKKKKKKLKKKKKKKNIAYTVLESKRSTDQPDFLLWIRVFKKTLKCISHIVK